MTAVVAHTSARSVGISVRVVVNGEEAVEGYMTFVAVSEHGAVLAVPPFHPETPEEVLRFREGALRREFRRKLERGELAPLVAQSSTWENASPMERGLLVGEALKRLPRSFRFPWERPSAPRTRHRSYIHKIEPVRQGKLNFHGTLYGGTVMRWLETSASLSARAWLDGAPVRLAGLHGLTFIRPVHDGYFVHVRSMVVHSEPNQLTALVVVHAEDPVAGETFETLRAFLSYAPLDDREIPAIECAGDEEQALFEEVAQRLSLQRSLRQR